MAEAEQHLRRGSKYGMNLYDTIANLEECVDEVEEFVDEETPLIASTLESEAGGFWVWCKLLLVPIGLLLLGTLCLSHMEHWSLLTSLYVVTQLVSTVGYGDYVVQEDASKLFVALFALVALVVCAYAISALADRLVQGRACNVTAYLEKMETTDSDSKEAKESWHEINELITQVSTVAVFIIFGTVLFRFLQPCACNKNSPAGCIDHDFRTCRATGGHGGSTIDAFYMSVMTLTTIGFGDVTPQTTLGRAISIPWMLIGVVVFAHALATWSHFFYVGHVTRRLKAKDEVHDITKDVFAKIDKDGNGSLDKAEFLAYTLLKYEHISDTLVDKIFEQYDEFEGAKEGKRITFEQISAMNAKKFKKKRG